MIAVTVLLLALTPVPPLWLIGAAGIIGAFVPW